MKREDTYRLSPDHLRLWAAIHDSDLRKRGEILVATIVDKTAHTMWSMGSRVLACMTPERKCDCRQCEQMSMGR